MPSNCVPNLVYIGLPKSGSTWLYELFKSHPQVYVPVAKDLYFFDKYYDKGMQWYLSHFSSAANFRYRVDISHDYLFSNQAISRISEQLPQAKLCCILRNPYDYIFSQYLFLQRCGYETGTLREAIKKFPYLLETSNYPLYLKSVISQVGKDKLIVWWFDELREAPDQFAEKVLDDLGLSYSECAEFEASKQVRSASRPKFKRLVYVLRILGKLMRQLGFSSFLGTVKHSRLVGLLFSNYEKKPTLPKEDFEYLTQFINPQLDELERLLGVNIEPWRSYDYFEVENPYA